jgi:hypothetical protein
MFNIIYVESHWSGVDCAGSHTCNPAFGRLRQEDHEFKFRPGYVVKPCQKKKEKERDREKKRRKEGRMEGMKERRRKGGREEREKERKERIKKERKEKATGVTIALIL